MDSCVCDSSPRRRLPAQRPLVALPATVFLHRALLSSHTRSVSIHLSDRNLAVDCSLSTGQVRRVLGALLVGLIRKWILLPGNGEATLAATTHTSLSAVRPMTTKPPELINSHDGG